MHGTSILHCEVTNTTEIGIDLLVQYAENRSKTYLIYFEDYEQFKTASVEKIYNVKMLSQNHIYWPELDIDIEIHALEHPEKYPLQYKSH